MNAPLPPSGVPTDLFPRLRIFRFIWFAATGVLALALVAVGVLCEPGNPESAGRTLSVVGLIVAPIWAVLAFVLPDWQAARSYPNLSGTFELYRAGRFIEAGYLLGAGAIQVFAYRDDGQWWSLALGGALVLLMLAFTPTRDRAVRWFQRRAKPSG
jgi:hypothetical protein